MVAPDCPRIDPRRSRCGCRTSSASRYRRAVTAVLLAAAACTSRKSPDRWTDDFGESHTDLGPTGHNAFVSLEPGRQLALESRAERLVITVLPETLLVDSVWTRVVEERETVDGNLTEVSRNFLAISSRTGNVYYFGEDVDVYENGSVAHHEGAWRAGVNGARFGLFMPAVPLLGARYQQETAPGIAMDRARVVALDDTVTTPAGRFEAVLRIEETTPLEPLAREAKQFVRGVGLIVDGSLRRVER